MRKMILQSALSATFVLSLAGAAAADDCFSDSECPEGYYCELGMRPAMDCAEGTDCTDVEYPGFCAMAPVPCTEDADCGSEYLSCVSDAGVPVDDGGTVEPAPAPAPEPLPPETAAKAAKQAETKSCQPAEVVDCSEGAACPTGYECVEVTLWCMAEGCAATPDGGEPVDCEPSEPVCETGMQCQPADIDCTADAECPTDWSCIEVGYGDSTCSSGGGGDVPVGAPVEVGGAGPTEEPGMGGGTHQDEPVGECEPAEMVMKCAPTALVPYIQSGSAGYMYGDDGLIYESAPPTADGPTAGGDPMPTTGEARGDTDASADSGADAASGDDAGGCTVSPRSTSGFGAFGLLLAALLFGRRRRS